MKIAINGDIIDTKDIYKITKVEWYYFDDSQIRVIFIIKLFGGAELKVAKYFNNYKIKNGYHYQFRGEVCERLAEIIVIKLSKFRQSIVDVWSENQPEIPQFNI